MNVIDAFILFSITNHKVRICLYATQREKGALYVDRPVVRLILYNRDFILMNMNASIDTSWVSLEAVDDN